MLPSYLTLRGPTKYSPPGLSVQGILQARILEWVAMPSSRGSSRPRDRTQVSHVSRTGGQILPRVPPGKSKPSGILALILLVAEAVFPLQFRMGSIPYQIDPLWGGASPTNTKETGLSLLKYQSHSVVSNSLRPHGLYSPWNSPGQNTGVGSFPFSRGPSQPRDRTQVSHIAGRFFTSL